MNIYWNDGTELYHYGIPGQKWGERRFQNEDGSLTEEGRRRYGVGDALRANRDARVVRDRMRVNKATNKRLQKAKAARAKDMAGFSEDALKNGIRDKNGKLIATSNDVKQWKKDTAAKHDQKISDIKKTSEYRNKALDIQSSMSLGKTIANDLLSSTAYNLGSKTYASLVASGYSEKNAQRINALLGATFGQVAADINAKKNYGIKRLRG